jgi:hypothetical protein
MYLEMNFIVYKANNQALTTISISSLHVCVCVWGGGGGGGLIFF